MEKLQELAKKGKLVENLMADKEFVDGAKEIFKSENIEIDDKKLTQLMGEIETQLKKSNVLDDKALEEVSGGITKKGMARGMIKAVTSISGTAVGYFLGSEAGARTGIAIGGAVGSKEPLPLTDELKEKIGQQTLPISKGEVLGGAAGVSVGAIGGTAGGGFLGYKLGQWICKKTGLEEK